MDINSAVPHAAAILYIWQPGIRGGTAVADVLLGHRNPSGRLAITFPLTTGHIPAYYSQRPHSRIHGDGAYRDLGEEPLYPFGHGLGYTTFEYGEVKLSSSKLKRNGKLAATVAVRNTGSRSGKETIFWYLSDPEATITQPRRKLIFFSQAELEPGEERTVALEIDPARDLAYVDGDGRRILESGRFLLGATKGSMVEFSLE